MKTDGFKFAQNWDTPSSNDSTEDFGLKESAHFD